MRMVIASSQEMPTGLALCVVVMTAEEVRQADWTKNPHDVPDMAYALLRDELPGQTELAFGRNREGR